VIAASVLYVALVSRAWAGNLMWWIVSQSLCRSGLVAVTLLSVFAQSLAMTGRFEMLGASARRRSCSSRPGAM
jgi:hypothetical protein